MKLPHHPLLRHRRCVACLTLLGGHERSRFLCEACLAAPEPADALSWRSALFLTFILLVTALWYAVETGALSR